MQSLWPWLTLALLGAYHGLNPAMGWLFAVALGLQERSRAAVLRAFAPIALGHATSVALVVALVGLAQGIVAPEALRIAGAIVLLAFGVYKLLARGAHPRWVGMRVGFRDLAAWSFLMSTAHGAGLMLVPILLRLPAGGSASTTHHGATHVMAAGSPAVLATTGLSAAAVHSAAMLVVMAGIAVVVYDKIGLAILRRAWINLDLVWAATLIAAGVLTLIV